MEFKLENLVYPGMFAQVEETGFVHAYRPTGWENDQKRQGKDDVVCIRVRGMYNGPLDKEFDSFEALLEEFPEFTDWEWIGEFVGDGQRKEEWITKQVQQIKEAVQQEYGAEVSPGFDRKNKIEQVRLNFKPEVWADLCNKEGELLPACCASISAIRDALVDALREDCWIRCDGLQLIANQRDSHDFEDPHPVKVIFDIWEMIEPVAHFPFNKEPEEFRKEDAERLSDALTALIEEAPTEEAKFELRYARDKIEAQAGVCKPRKDNTFLGLKED